MPATSGSWTAVDSHTLSFQPSGLGFGARRTVHVRLPRSSLRRRDRSRWHVPARSTLRLQEILARLGYLPLRWHGQASPPTTAADEVAAAVSPPAGHFSWRFPNTPALAAGALEGGQPNEVTRAAVMRFEDQHGLATDGIAGPQVWRVLLRDDLAGRRYTAGYSYVFVHETSPQSLNLWHNGKVILSSPGNTGIAQAPTAQGTWPVFEHISSGTMSGTNPDGSHYNDPGHPLDQLLPRRRRDPRLPAGHVRDAAEPRLRRAAPRRGRAGLAVHADRHARHDRVLSAR